MSPHEIWLILVAVATPVAAVVGFTIQLREVRKLRLENRKLALEVSALEMAAATADNRIVMPSTQEVANITNGLPLFSRRAAVLESLDMDGDIAARNHGFSSTNAKDVVVAFLAVAAVAFVAGYFLYDLYRFALWLLTKL